MSNTTGTNGKVTPLFLSRRFMKDHITEEILTYWESLRAGRLVPKRSEIDPRRLPLSLNHTFILEASAPDNIRFRLVGSKLCDCLGMEMRGMPAYAMFAQAERNRFNVALQASLASPEILDFQLTPDARMVLLPMADEDNSISRVLGCINVNPMLPQFPTYFAVKSLTKTRIIAAEPIRPTLVKGLAEGQKPFSPDTKKATSGKPPHLRIVK